MGKSYLLRYEDQLGSSTISMRILILWVKLHFLRTSPCRFCLNAPITAALTGPFRLTYPLPDTSKATSRMGAAAHMIENGPGQNKRIVPAAESGRH